MKALPRNESEGAGVEFAHFLYSKREIGKELKEMEQGGNINDIVRVADLAKSDLE